MAVDVGKTRCITIKTGLVYYEGSQWTVPITTNRVERIWARAQAHVDADAFMASNGGSAELVNSG